MKKFLIVLFATLLTGFLIPENFQIPVKGANLKSYNQSSFWYYPWGASGVHKGVDVFAKEGTSVLSSTPGIVLYSGTIKLGGNVVLTLGPKWRLYYYAHLKDVNTSVFSFLSSGEGVGTIGTTGNAKGKSPHLHFTILTLIPYPWRMDSSRQGWKKMFYLNPIEQLKKL